MAMTTLARKVLAILVSTFLTGTVAARVPVPLLDPDGSEVMNRHDITNWKELAPLLKEAAECRRTVAGTPALRALLHRQGSASLLIIVPPDFTVFGLPVQAVAISPSGTASMVIAHHLEAVQFAMETGQPSVSKKLVGRLSVEERVPTQLIDVICSTESL
jgi:hypothetical protein